MALLTDDSDDGRASPEATRAAHIGALKRELAGYEALGKTDRANLVRAELKRLGVSTATAKAGKAEQATVTADAEHATA